MQTDGPTQTNLPSYNPSDLGSSPEPSQTPTWPRPRESGPRGAGYERTPFGSLYPLILGISFLANVVLILALGGVLLFGHAGVFSPSGSSSGGSGAGAGLTSPTATATAAATSTPASNGGLLQVTPSSVHLGCNGDQQTQFVTLANNGSGRVRWQASIPGGGDQSGISVNPGDGSLHAGQSVRIQIQLVSNSGGQQGTIQFITDSSGAGAPATLTYTADSCGG